MKKRSKTIQKLMIAPALLSLALTALAGGCGNTSYEKGPDRMEPPMEAAGAYYEDSYPEAYDMEEAAIGDWDASADMTASNGAAPEVNESSETVQGTDRKLVKTISMDAETEEFDALTADLKAKTEKVGGYIESSSVSSDSGYYDYDRGNELPPLREASYTIRIPADRLEAFLSSVASHLNILSRNENVEDITLNYVDMESHKKALREEQDRLYQLMTQAGDLDELIVLEERLTEVTYQIESIEAQLRTYDNLVNYSTVYMNISEVRKYTPVEEETPMERIERGFTERMEAIGLGFQNVGIWVAVHVLDIALVVILIIIILIVIWALVRGISHSIMKNDAKRQVRSQKLLAREQQKAAEQAARERRKAQEHAAKMAGKYKRGQAPKAQDIPSQAQSQSPSWNADQAMPITPEPSMPQGTAQIPGVSEPQPLPPAPVNGTMQLPDPPAVPQFPEDPAAAGQNETAPQKGNEEQ